MKFKRVLMLMLFAVICNVSSFAQTDVKYHAEVDLGYSTGVGEWCFERVNLHTVQGVKIGNNFSVGLGLGVDYYYDLEEAFMPITVNAKGYLPVSNKVSPFISLDLGYGVGLSNSGSGFTYTPAIGVKLSKFKIQVGYNCQKITESGLSLNMGAIQLKLGFMF